MIKSQYGRSGQSGITRVVMMPGEQRADSQGSGVGKTIPQQVPQTVLGITPSSSLARQAFLNFKVPKNTKIK
jgi:hypothetical protein